MSGYFEQVDLERKFSKEYANHLVKEFFREHIQNKVLFKAIQLIGEALNKIEKENEIDEIEITISILRIVAVLKVGSFQAVIAKASHLFTGTQEEKFIKASYIISILEASGLILVSKPRQYFKLKQVALSFELPEYVTKIIENTAYVPPTLVPCEPKNNSDAGWLTFKKSIFLNINHHEGNAPLHWLRVLNNISFSIDLHMLKHEEEPSEDILSDPDKLRAFNLLSELTKRSIKEVLAYGNIFHFVHRYCARYRAYASGYAISPQGNDYRKSLLNLSTKHKMKNEYNF